MASKIEGYTIVLTGKGLERFRRQYKDQFMVVKHKYDAREGEYPGNHDDYHSNFTRGSQWASADGSLFVCIDATPKKAKWIKIAGELSKGSYVEDESETEDTGTPGVVDGPEQKEDADSGSGPEPDPEETDDSDKGEGIPTKEELEKEGIDTKSPGKELDEKAPLTTENKKAKGVEFSAGDDAPDDQDVSIPKKKDLYKVEIPDEVPYKNRLVNDNRVQNLGHLVEHIKNNTLHELKHINEERAQNIKDVVRKYT